MKQGNSIKSYLFVNGAFVSIIVILSIFFVDFFFTDCVSWLFLSDVLYFLKGFKNPGILESLEFDNLG